MELYIKNMVCNRCKMVVQTELNKLGLHPISVELGVVEISEDAIDPIRSADLSRSLKQVGFELLLDKKSQIVEQIKTAIIELVHYKTEKLSVNLSTYLSEQLALSYVNLSSAFSEVEDVTIEQYFIQQKIEKVKELLTYGEKSLSEISYILDYSSVAHLSAQFKKVTGETPTSYKLRSHRERKTLDEV